MVLWDQVKKNEELTDRMVALRISNFHLAYRFLRLFTRLIFTTAGIKCSVAAVKIRKKEPLKKAQNNKQRKRCCTFHYLS